MCYVLKLNTKYKVTTKPYDKVFVSSAGQAVNNQVSVIVVGNTLPTSSWLAAQWSNCNLEKPGM